MAARGSGRPSKYLPAYAKQARALCLLGATNPEIASSLDVSLTTVNRWMVEFPPFRNAIKEGREVADANVADALYRRAIGTKTTPPDTAAAFIWLKNRRPDKWRDKPEGSGRMSPEEIVAMMAAVRDATAK